MITLKTALSFSIGFFIGTLFSSLCHAEPIKIAVIDTGFTQLEGRLKARLCPKGHYDFYTERPEIGFSHPHGSWVTSIIVDTVDSTMKSEYCILEYQIITNVVDIKTTADVMARAIRMAADNGAAIINISVTGKKGTKEEANAVHYAVSKGAQVYAASGNDHVNLGELCDYYPACYTQVHAIGAMHDPTHLCDVSNYGGKVEMYFGEYGGRVCATSFSTPRASALAALRVYYSRLKARPRDNTALLRMLSGKPFINTKAGICTPTKSMSGAIKN